MRGRSTSVFLAACLATGCAAGVSAPSPQTVQQDKVAASGNTLELQGSWRGLCHASDDGGSFAREVVVTGEQLSYRQFAYADGLCSELDSIVTIQSQVSVGGALVGHPSARALDELIQGAWIDVLSEGAANQLNASAMCGRSDWKASDSSDLGGCMMAPGVALEEGATIYATYARTDDRELLVSDGSHGAVLSMALAPAQRPTAPNSDGFCAYYKDSSANE